MNDRILSLIGIAVKGGRVKFGVFQTERAINEGKAKLVVIASDTGESNKRKLTEKCQSFDTQLILYSSKEKLSRAVGKENVPAVAICDEGLAAAIVKIFGGADK